MKFSVSTTINKPRAVVVKYFVDPQYLGKYQEGFVRKKHISGEFQQAGAKSIMYYDMGKRGIMELYETITENNLPDFFVAQYHHEHMDNTMRVAFSEIDLNTTRYETEIHYTVFRGIMVKMMSFLFPSMLTKPPQRWLDNFKKFVESQE